MGQGFELTHRSEICSRVFAPVRYRGHKRPRTARCSNPDHDLRAHGWRAHEVLASVVRPKMRWDRDSNPGGRRPPAFKAGAIVHSAIPPSPKSGRPTIKTVLVDVFDATQPRLSTTVRYPTYTSAETTSAPASTVSPTYPSTATSGFSQRNIPPSTAKTNSVP